MACPLGEPALASFRLFAPSSLSGFALVSWWPFRSIDLEVRSCSDRPRFCWSPCWARMPFQVARNGPVARLGAHPAWRLKRRPPPRSRTLDRAALAQRGYRDLIDTFEDVLLSLSPDGEILAANRSFTHLLGRSLEVVGRSLDEFMEVTDDSGLARLGSNTFLPRRRHSSGVSASDSSREAGGDMSSVRSTLWSARERSRAC